MPFYHPYYYIKQDRHDRRPRGHQVRDGLAMSELEVAVRRLGWDHGVPFLQYPRSTLEIESCAEQGATPPLEEVDDSRLGPGDLLLVSTRPPLSDVWHKDKLRINPSFTTLEEKLFRVCREHFRTIARSFVWLQQPFAPQLSQGYENRFEIVFAQHRRAFYLRCRRADGTHPEEGFRDRRTAAFLLHLKSVPLLNGAALLVALGQGGIETLAWAHRLRTDQSWRLDEESFTVVEFKNAACPERPADLRFAESWEIAEVLRAKPLRPLVAAA